MHTLVRRFVPLFVATVVTLAPAGAPSLAVAQRQSPSAEAQANPESGSASGVVNLNTATAEELQRLPGIGPSKAQAILELRQRAGQFRRLEDVLRVRGIGRVTFRRLRPMLTLQGPTTLTEETSRRRPRSTDDAEEAPSESEN